ncbi:unnamed protein product [Bursaphelenchus okinawaensis]|uniref:KIF-binding protein n=1 Tax=Bursaphelenchus okinawaensis TaxID=465554 RepID=A0A811LLI4_9BILA|nr:unnamed protein product [Bursaphelenchus okinawaensis]CAG9126417.1 unnamed protein product [Bursaphelenchus okinawaensis]
MKDQNQLETAAMCNIELSLIYKDLEDTLSERECMLEAAKCFEGGHRENNGSYIPTENGLLPQLEQSYVKIAEMTLRDKCLKNIGVVLVQLATTLMEFQQYLVAYEYLFKATKYLTAEFYFRLMIFEKCIVCLEHSEDLASDLMDLTSMYSKYIRNERLNGVVKDRMVTVELKLVLLHLKQYSEDWEMRPRSFLANYSTYIEHTTVMTKAEHGVVSEFIEAFVRRDYLKLCYMMHSELWDKLDDHGRKLMNTTIQKTAPSTGILNEELVITEVDELDRRKKMIEWHKSVKRSHVASYQHI